MIIDFHTHLIAQGWVPREIFHGIVRFVTHESAKQGIQFSPEKVIKHQLYTAWRDR